MSSVSNADFAPYSMGGLNLKRSLGVSALTKTQEQSGLVGQSPDMLSKNLMDRENYKIKTSAAVPSALENNTLSGNLGNSILDNDLQQTILGGRTGIIVSKLI